MVQNQNQQHYQQRPNQQQPRKNNRPNFAVMMRKFYRDVQQSRILSEAKKRRFRERPVSRTDRRLAAIRQARVKKLRRGY